METLHIYVGTDRWQQAAGAERVLEYSIRKHATCDVAFHWMRSGDQGWEVSPDGAGGSWRIGREPGTAWPKVGWGTDFSCFRFAIPEVHGFEGRAVYMDVDMLVIGDVRELLEWPMSKPWVCTHPQMTDVSIIECSQFLDRQWPTLEELKMFPGKAYHHVQRLNQSGLLSPSLSWNWNCRDSSDEWTEDTRLLHFTSVPHQPWHPYPTVKYAKHPKKAWADRWFAEKDEVDAIPS
jgi:hypothetical protein